MILRVHEEQKHREIVHDAMCTYNPFAPFSISFPCSAPVIFSGTYTRAHAHAHAHTHRDTHSIYISYRNISIVLYKPRRRLEK
jgi:hypothetical protein